MTNPSIALLHYSCPPVVGGVEEILHQQASLFHRHYYQVKIFAGKGKQFTEKYEVEINPLLGSRNAEILRLQKNLQSREELRRVEKRLLTYLSGALSPFDVVIAHNVLTMPYNLPLTFVLHELANRGDIRLISWNHDSPYFYEDHPAHLHSEPWTVLKAYNPNVTYITITESRREQFCRLYGRDCEIHVIPNGIDPFKFFKLDRSTVRLIQEQRLFDADLILVQPSRLHPRKNIELSVQVVHALQRKGIRARLLVTGAYDPHEEKTVEYYRKIKRLARQLGVEEDVLIMAEYRFASGERLEADRITIRDLYLIADVLFMPSHQEGFGIPLLEAGMIKLPIVCSDIGPFREIGDEAVCYFALNEEPERIAEKMLDFLNRQEPHRMYRKVISNFVWDSIFERKMKPLLEKIARRDGRSLLGRGQ